MIGRLAQVESAAKVKRQREISNHERCLDAGTTQAGTRAGTRTMLRLFEVDRSTFNWLSSFRIRLQLAYKHSAPRIGASLFFDRNRFNIFPRRDSKQPALAH